MPDWTPAFIVPLVIGVVLLVIEYRTGWFASRLTKTPDSSIDVPDDWSTAIYQVKLGLVRIYAVNLGEIQVDKWNPSFFGFRIRLQVLIPGPVVSKLYGVERRDIRYLIVWADRSGRILKTKETGPGFVPVWR